MHTHYCMRYLLSLLIFVFVCGYASAESFLNVQPIQVCDNSGNNCANAAQNLYLDITEAIWAQADITINFLPWVSVNNTTYQNPDNLYHIWLSGAVDVPSQVVALWFVDTLPGSGVLGTTQVGGPWSAVDDLTFSGGYSDVIAHELGHTLGLVHNTDALALMNPSPRIPGSVDDIYPAPNGTDELFPDEIARALQSNLLTSAPIPASATTVPEPWSLLYACLALCVLLPLCRVVRRYTIERADTTTQYVPGASADCVSADSSRRDEKILHAAQ